MTEHYDMDGEPLGLWEWAELMDDPARLLRQEWVLGRDKLRAWVSTVWIGIDHNYNRMVVKAIERFADEGPEKEFALEQYDTRPWIFETMAFEGVSYGNRVHAVIGDELWQERCATKEEALATHELVCARFRLSGPREARAW